jgi:hypothetical protein
MCSSCCSWWRALGNTLDEARWDGGARNGDEEKHGGASRLPAVGDGAEAGLGSRHVLEVGDGAEVQAGRAASARGKMAGPASSCSGGDTRRETNRRGGVVRSESSRR